MKKIRKYDLQALQWILTWVTAALLEKNNIESRVTLLEKCIKEWKKEMGNSDE